RESGETVLVEKHRDNVRHRFLHQCCRTSCAEHLLLSPVRSLARLHVLAWPALLVTTHYSLRWALPDHTRWVLSSICRALFFCRPAQSADRDPPSRPARRRRPTPLLHDR